MSKKIIYICFLFGFICSCQDNEINNTPYDPEKAGAVILEKYDISDHIVFSSKESALAFGHDLAEYGDYIFIRIEDRIIVFNKQTMIKEKEIKLKLPETYNNYANVWGNLQGLVVTDQYALILCRNNFWSVLHPTYLQIYHINLETGNIKIIDNMDKFGSELESRIWETMGYNKNKNLLWFCVFKSDSDNSTLSSYSYNDETEKFVLQSENSNFLSRDFLKYYRLYDELFINSANLWTISFGEHEYFINEKNWYLNSIISKRCINNQYKILYEIKKGYLGLDINYLKRTRISESLLLDDPYIWIMVEIDNKIQLLKLLPHE